MNTDKTRVVFGNEIDKKTVRRANKSKKRYLKKYGDDSDANYKLAFSPIDALDFIEAQNINFGEQNDTFADNALIVGNIRMGFGHYRISIAMASCAHALGYTPYWLDLASFDAVGSKMIREQNNLYSLASRISQKSKLFNALVWEPMNSEGFKKITYNAVDQKNSELLVPVFENIDKNIPYIATHVWPSQAAVHAGMKHVVNAIPDNWPMALHLSEGAMHAVQTPFAYLGYKTLDGFAEKPLKGIPEQSIKAVGRFIDHELLVDIENDNRRRKERIASGNPLRLLLTVGGAGAGFDMFVSTVKHILPYVKAKKVALFINFGDHKNVCEKLIKAARLESVKTYFNDYDGLKKLVAELKDGNADGVFAIYNDDIFRAVYSTNLLMPVCDLLITKPSELAYYPIPKIFMRHIGGHEVYGAINGRELGDSLDEYPTAKRLNSMIDKLLSDNEIIPHICDRITELKAQGYYNGAYECVRLATSARDTGLPK